MDPKDTHILIPGAHECHLIGKRDLADVIGGGDDPGFCSGTQVPLFAVVQSLSCVWLFVTPWITAHQTSVSFTPRVCSNSCPLSWTGWDPTISSSDAPFSPCPRSCPASVSFPMSHFFALGAQSISFSFLPMNIQSWFPLALTSLISLQSKGFSRVFSSTTVQKHQFFGTQPSLWFNSHFHPWLPKNP